MVRVVKVTSANNNISYGGFNGDISFTYENPKGYWSSPKQTFMMVRLRIVQTDEDGTGHPLTPIINTGTRAAPTAVSIPFLNNNFLAGLFSNITVSVDNKQIVLVQNIASVVTLFRTLYESSEENRTSVSLCAITPLSQTDVDVVANKSSAVLSDYFTSNINIGGADTAINWTGTSLSNHQLYALKHMIMFNRFNENEILMQIPASLFLSDNYIPHGVKIDVKFTVDPNYATNLINIAGSNVSALGGVNYTIGTLTSAASNVGTINNISIGVVDFQIWNHCIKRAPPKSVVPVSLRQWSSTQIAIPNGSTGPSDLTAEFIKDRRISHVCLAFVQSKGVLKKSTTDLSSGFFIGTNGRAVANGNATYTDTPNAASTGETYSYTTSPIAQLINLRLQINSQCYPETPYSLQMDYLQGQATPTNSLSQDTFRAYTDFVSETGLRDRSGCISYDQWLLQPIFVFKLNPASDDRSNSAIITYGFKNGVTNANLLAVAFYEDVIHLDYDNSGVFKRLSLDTII